MYLHYAINFLANYRLLEKAEGITIGVSKLNRNVPAIVPGFSFFGSPYVLYAT